MSNPHGLGRISITDHHDVSFEDVWDWQQRAWGEHPQATDHSGRRFTAKEYDNSKHFTWKCCGAPGENGISHKCDKAAGVMETSGIPAPNQKIASLDHANPDWRTMTHENGARKFAADGTMLDERGNRSVFDDVDE